MIKKVFVAIIALMTLGATTAFAQTETKAVVENAVPSSPSDATCKARLACAPTECVSLRADSTRCHYTDSCHRGQISKRARRHGKRHLRPRRAQDCRQVCPAPRTTTTATAE